MEATNVSNSICTWCCFSKEILVIASSICLLFISTASRVEIKFRSQEGLPDILYRCEEFLPILGVVLVTYLSELKGRKPIFIALSILSTLASILLTIRSEVWLNIATILQVVVGAGALPITFLSIVEYSSPKNRFAYLVVNSAAWHITRYSLNLMSILNIEPLYKRWYQIVLGAICFLAGCAWPESPYWLAGRGRFEECQQVLYWLRGDDLEFSFLKKQCARQNSPRLFWRFFSIVTITAFLYLFDTLFLNVVASSFFLLTYEFVFITISSSAWSIATVLAIIALMSYKVKRRVIFITICGATFVLSYVFAIWHYIYTGYPIPVNTDGQCPITFFNVFIMFNILRICCLLALSVVYCFEVIPFKYNTKMACICFLYTNVIMYLPEYYTMSQYPSYLNNATVGASTLYHLLGTTLSLCAVGLFVLLIPETKDQSLSEIQMLYFSEQNSDKDQGMYKINEKSRLRYLLGWFRSQVGLRTTSYD